MTTRVFGPGNIGVIAAAGDAAAVVRRDGRILYWKQGAATLLDIITCVRWHLDIGCSVHV